MERESAACDGTMVAVLGLDAAQSQPVCLEASRQSGETVQIANLNAPGQVVLSGHRSAIHVASELAKPVGAKRVLPLTVGGPFHSSYMAPAATDFCAMVGQTRFVDARAPIVLNTTAAPATEADALLEELCSQVSRAVRWEASLRPLEHLGCSAFLELVARSSAAWSHGPSPVLPLLPRARQKGSRPCWTRCSARRPDMAEPGGQYCTFCRLLARRER